MSEAGGAQRNTANSGLSAEESTKLRLKLSSQYGVALRALTFISKIGGWTCDDYPECTHSWCANSYRVWTVAEKALQDLREIEDG